MLGNTEEKAKDFLQDIFVKIIERPDLFDPSRRFSTWLFSVAHNMCKNEYRRIAVRSIIKKEENLDQLAESHVPSMMDTRLTADQIFREIDGMGETDRTAFILFYREDFSLQEIAQVLELPEGTIKSKLFYIRKKISRKLHIQDVK
jgi:RNA polymerase sigma-70 factor (ECF subfamily)